MYTISVCVCVCVCVIWKLIGCVQLFVTPWTPLSMAILQARILEWVAMPSSSGYSQPSNWSQVFCIAGGFFTYQATREAHVCEREQINKKEWVRVRKQLHYCIRPIPALWLYIFQRALFPFIGECFYCILGLLITVSPSKLSLLLVHLADRVRKYIFLYQRMHIHIPIHAFYM